MRLRTAVSYIHCSFSLFLFTQDCDADSEIYCCHLKNQSVLKCNRQQIKSPDSFDKNKYLYNTEHKSCWSAAIWVGSFTKLCDLHLLTHYFGFK